VQERWNEEMDRVGEQAFRRTCQFLALDPSEPLAASTSSEINDPGSLQRKMKLLMAITERDNLEKDPFAFMLVWFLRYQIEQANERKGTTTEFYKALYDWGKENVRHLQGLERIANEILERPKTETMQDKAEAQSQNSDSG
jgi:hypothetical protein